jgi:hypothetical protein
MLPSRINPEKCLQKTECYPKELDQVAIISNPEELKSSLLTHCQTEEQENAVEEYLLKHIGVASTFTHIEQLKKYLSYIVAVLNGKVASIQPSENNKSAIMVKLTEEIKQCTPGFLNRVYVIVGSFNQPRSIDALLCAYRLQLVEKAHAKSKNDEQHAHHRFHVVANTLGYGIPYEDTHDVHPGKIPDDKIQQLLTDTFMNDYQPHKIVTHLWDQAMLDQLGYVGRQKDYTYEVFTAILDYFRMVFNKPDIGIHDCFIIDKKTDAVKDINWIYINSCLIQCLNEHHYFLPLKEKKVLKGKVEGAQYRIEYTFRQFPIGELTYQSAEGKTLYGYTSGLRHPLCPIMPKKLIAHLRSTIKHRFNFNFDLRSLLRVIQLRTAGLISHDRLQSACFKEINTMNFFLKFLEIHSLAIQEKEWKLFIEVMKKKLPLLITNFDDLYTVSLQITAPQFNLLWKVMKENLGRKLNDLKTIESVLRTFSNDKCRIIFHTVNVRSLDAVIGHTNCLFQTALWSSNSEYHKNTLELLHDIMPRCVPRLFDLRDALIRLSHSNARILLNSLKSFLPELIKDLNDVEKIFKVLDPSMCRIVYEQELVKDIILQAIQTPRLYKYIRYAFCNEALRINITYCLIEARYCQGDALNDYYSIANSFIRIYKAMQASFTLFKPSHRMFEIGKWDITQIMFSAAATHTTQCSMIKKAWKLALKYKSDGNPLYLRPGLIQSIGNWSKKHSTLFNTSIVYDEGDDRKWISTVSKQLARVDILKSS